MGLSFELAHIFDTQVFGKSTVLINKWIIVRELHACFVQMSLWIEMMVMWQIWVSSTLKVHQFKLQADLIVWSLIIDKSLVSDHCKTLIKSWPGASLFPRGHRQLRSDDIEVLLRGDSEWGEIEFIVSLIGFFKVAEIKCFFLSAFIWLFKAGEMKFIVSTVIWL